MKLDISKLQHVVGTKQGGVYQGWDIDGPVYFRRYPEGWALISDEQAWDALRTELRAVKE
jgi:hypothetical protein